MRLTLCLILCLISLVSITSCRKEPPKINLEKWILQGTDISRVQVEISSSGKNWVLLSPKEKPRVIGLLKLCNIFVLKEGRTPPQIEDSCILRFRDNSSLEKVLILTCNYTFINEQKHSETLVAPVQLREQLRKVLREANSGKRPSIENAEVINLNDFSRVSKEQKIKKKSWLPRYQAD